MPQINFIITKKDDVSVGSREGLIVDVSQGTIKARKNSIANANVLVGQKNPTINEVSGTATSQKSIYVPEVAGTSGQYLMSQGPGKAPTWGTTNIKGDRGFQGFQGFTGPQGVRGYQGHQGPTGPTGARGYQGYQGPTGPTGAASTVRGPQGYQGPEGTPYFSSGTGSSSSAGNIGTKYTVYAPAFYEASDVNLKNIISDLKEKISIEDIISIPKKYFTFKNDKNQEVKIGTIAQEVKKKFPELVDEDIESGFMGVQYNKLAIIALLGVELLYDKIKELESK
mgnify:CR=1 FL=1